MSERQDYDDFADELEFQGVYQGEPIVVKVRIWDDGTVNFIDGYDVSDNPEYNSDFKPEDIVGLNFEELEKVVERAREVKES